MGKSEKGAVFLDAELTSPYDFYQYWINDDDELVIDHLRWLTTKRPRRDRGDRRRARRAPERRAAQKALAYDLTARIHGRDEADRQVAMAGAAFARSVDDPTVLAALYDAVGGFEFGSEADAWTALDVAVAAAGAVAGRGPTPHLAGRLLGQRREADRPGSRAAGPHRRPLLVGGHGQEAPLRGPPRRPSSVLRGAVALLERSR